MLKICIFLLLWGMQGPWGKDADIVGYKQECVSISESPPTMISKIAESLILFHQQVISPADGPRSNYLPSSSQYTLDAIRKYGFCYGFLLGCDRLMRENTDTWVYPVVLTEQGVRKYDPVR